MTGHLPYAANAANANFLLVHVGSEARGEALHQHTMKKARVNSVWAAIRMEISL
jgi:hypothetical protein